MLSEFSKEHIRSLSDPELAEYVAIGEQIYEPEAVTFAQQEFATRKLDERAVLDLQLQVKAQLEQEAAARQIAASAPLDFSGRLLAFIAGLIGIASLPTVFHVWVKMDIRGENQKARDTKRFFAWGFAIDLAVWVTAIVIVCINRNLHTQ
jgi:hypothetical protein